MNFIADLHIHSRFSMATSKALTIPNLAQWAIRKGIDVLASGDFTHPQWRAELKQELAFDEESGFYKLKNSAPGPAFCLQTEISCIYKSGGKTRKIHNIIYAPTFAIAEKIANKLSALGNIETDGRPILKLDCHDLLEIIRDISSETYLIPAHIWTPHYALFGSKSGFDNIQDCFRDLTSEIFTLETGLSSDPPMNRLISGLDRFALISSSDAHSGQNLGREANLFSGKPTYNGMFSALRAASRRENPLGRDCAFLGTLEYNPRLGKYHLDGHRKCGFSLDPAQSGVPGNICPVCKKPLTFGTLRRVLQLADRDMPIKLQFEPETRLQVPLIELLAHLLQTSAASKKTAFLYGRTLAKLGPELQILCLAPLEKINDYWPLLGEAIARMRKNNIKIEPGFDGKYGKLEIFTPQELKEFENMPLNIK